MNFKELTPDQMAEIVQRRIQSQRSPELAWAHANADKLRKEHETVGMTELAKKYKVNKRSLYRIIRGK